MAEYTEHYAIAKHGPFGEGEALSAYSIVNVAMDTIDDILWEHKGLIDDLEARVTALEQRMSAAEANINQINQDISNLENDINNSITNIEGDITTITGDLSDLEGNVGAIWQAIANILTKINGSNSVDASSGSITWGIDGNIAVGNINLYSSSAGYIRTTTNTLSSPGSNDVRVQ